MRHFIFIFLFFVSIDCVLADEIFNDGTSTPFAKYNEELWDEYVKETKYLTVEEIHSRNLTLVKKLNQYRPTKRSTRAAKISFSQTQQLWQVMKFHPVVSPEQAHKYEPVDIRIGYCFGRAMYAHLMLLKLGLQKESILKVWAIGKAKTPEVTWDFHVATLTYTPEQGWIAIDPYFGHAMPAVQWMQNMSAMNINKRMRFYVTSPQKFSMGVGKYNPGQLGLNLEAEKDWYRNYFVHLLKSVREEKLSDLGLLPLNKTP